MSNYSDKFRRICFSNNIVAYIDIIDKFLKDFTKERIEKGNLLLSTYAKSSWIHVHLMNSLIKE